MSNPLPAAESPSSDRSELITETGWRLKGKAASLIEHPDTGDSLSPGRDEDVLFACRFQLRPRLISRGVIGPALDAINAAIAVRNPDSEPLRIDQPSSVKPDRFNGLTWQPTGAPRAWKGRLVWRHPHPVISGVPCTTDLELSEQQGHASMSLRVTADRGIGSVRGLVGVGQARPAFLSEMNRSLRLCFGGLEPEPRTVTEAEIDDFVTEVLLAEDREYAVALLTPTEEGEYLLPPSVVSDELLGLAHLYVIPEHPATFRLSDALGDRRLSCYWGALRVYQPEFSCADNPEDHPLLMRDRLLDPVIRSGVVGKVAQHLLGFGRVLAAPPRRAAWTVPSAPEAPRRTETAPHVESSVAVTVEPVDHVGQAAVLPDEVARTMAELGSLPAAVGNLERSVGSLVDIAAELLRANSGLREEVARLSTTSALRAANTAALERRIRSLEQLLVRATSVPGPATYADGLLLGLAAAEAEREDDDDAASIVDVLRQATTAHQDALLILDAAERSAADTPFEDAERVAIILDAMAAVARRRQEGGLGTSLRIAFREMGIEYRGGIASTTPAKLLQQYNVIGPAGHTYDCHEHIVLGTSYDPRFCLRIYFTSRAELEPRFVIGHVGRHFDVVSTT